MIYATIDIETTGLNRYKDKVTWVGIGLTHSKDEDTFFKEYYLDMDDASDLETFKWVINNLLKCNTRWCWQNGKFDTLFIEHHYGFKNLPIHYDTMLMGTIYDLAGEHSLKIMAIKKLKVPNWDIPKKDKTSKDPEKVLPYLKKDIKYTWLLVLWFYARMTESHWKQYKKLLRPAYLMYRDVERYGMPLNQKLLKEAKIRYRDEEKRKLAILNGRYKINWNSPAQLQELLFEKKNLPVIKLSEKTGKPSADAKVLKRLAAKGYELPTLILDYKSTNTIVKMFLNRWEEDSSYDGRIHPSFGLTNVRTGRTSCSNPNLQQVPRLKDIRSMYRPGKGRQFFEADYSQLELRIAAHYAKEPTMLEIFRRKGDIHMETAKSLVSGKEATGEDRGNAKAVNFGFVYGMRAKGFVSYAFDSYGRVFSIKEAEHYREMFFLKYARLLPWHDEMAAYCGAMGGVENLFGRFRALPLIYSNNRGEYNSAARRAINTPVQSSGSDLLISAATQINKELRGENVHICTTVHDSIIGEFDEGNEDWLLPEIKRIMIHPKVLDDFNVKLLVDLDVDIGIGPWGTH